MYLVMLHIWTYTHYSATVGLMTVDTIYPKLSSQLADESGSLRAPSAAFTRAVAVTGHHPRHCLLPGRDNSVEVLAPARYLLPGLQGICRRGTPDGPPRVVALLLRRR